MAGISLEEAYGEAPTSEAKPATPRGISLEDAYEETSQTNDPLKLPKIAATRALRGVVSIPGLPADLANLMARYIPGAGGIPYIGPALALEKARMAAQGADSMVPLGSENIREAWTDFGILPTPPKAITASEKLVGNIAEFAGASLGPGGSIKGLKDLVVPAVRAIGGGTGLTVGQELAPNSGLVQMLLSLGGGLTPEATRAGATSLKALAGGTSRALTEKGQAKTIGETLERAAPGRSTRALAASPVPGVKPTLAQAANDEELLALQEHAAGKDPALAATLARREQENKTAARAALEDVRGQGVPANAVTHAADEVRLAEEAVAAQRALQRTNRDQASISDAVRDRIEAARQTARTEENRLWSVFRALGDQASVPVAPLRTSMMRWLNQQDIRQPLPPEIRRALDQFGPSANVTRIQALRPELRELRQTAEAANDARSARVYSGLERVVGDHLDSVTFTNPALSQAYREAREFSRQRAGVFNLPRTMRTTLGSDAQGAERVASGSTLDKFLKSGPEGRDAVRSLLAADGSPEMRNLVADYLTAEMPEGAEAARKWISNHEPVLRELGNSGATSWVDRFHAVADRQAALEALRKSPLGMLNNFTPEEVIGKIMTGSDPAGTAKVLRDQMRSNPAAWAGMQRAFADTIIGKITDLRGTARDLADRPSIIPGELTRLTHEQAELARILLPPTVVQTLKNIDEALQIAGRRAAGPVANPKTALPSLTGARFIDKVIERLARPETPWAGAATGFAVGNVPGALAGYAGGHSLQTAASNTIEQLNALFRDAIMNPEIGSLLMRRASARVLPTLPRKYREFFRDFVPVIQGAAVATEGGKPPTYDTPTSTTSEPQRGAAAVSPPGGASPPPASRPGAAALTLPEAAVLSSGQGGPDGQGTASRSRSGFDPNTLAGLPPEARTALAPFRGNPALLAQKAQELDPYGRWRGVSRADPNAALPSRPQPTQMQPSGVRAEPENAPRLPAHEVSREAFMAMDPAQQQHILDALNAPTRLDLSDIEADRRSNVARSTDQRREFNRTWAEVDAEGAQAEGLARAAEGRPLTVEEMGEALSQLTSMIAQLDRRLRIKEPVRRPTTGGGAYKLQ